MKKPVIEQVFLIYRDGRLISYASTNMDDNIDEDIVGGMLVAVMKFISFALGELKEDSSIDEYKFGFAGRSLLLEMGENFFIAMVVLGNDYESLLANTRVVITDIEKQYRPVLEDWLGDVDDFEGVDDLILSLLTLDDSSESEWKEMLIKERRERIFQLWSSKYLHILQKSLMPKARVWNNLNLQLNSNFKKGSSSNSNKEGSSEHK